MSETNLKKRGLHWLLVLLIAFLVGILVFLLIGLVFDSDYLDLIEETRILLIAIIVSLTAFFSVWVLLGCKRYRGSKGWNIYNMIHIIAYAASTYLMCKKIDEIVMSAILQGYRLSECRSLKSLIIILMIISTIIKIAIYGCTYKRTETPLNGTTEEITDN